MDPRDPGPPGPTGRFGRIGTGFPVRGDSSGVMRIFKDYLTKRAPSDVARDAVDAASAARKPPAREADADPDLFLHTADGVTFRRDANGRLVRDP